MVLNSRKIHTVVRLCLVGLIMSFLGFLLSCESMVDIVPESRIGEIKPKLVVHAYISPQDTMIRVFVTESIPVFKEIGESGQHVIKDARVVLSDSRQEVVLNYDSTYQAYTIAADRMGGIQAGYTYRLKVQDESRSVEASTTIPSVSPAIASYKVDTSYTSSGTGFGRRDTTLAVQFTWRDPAGHRNFYRVIGKAIVIMDYREYESDGVFIYKRGRVTMPLYWDNSYGRSDFQSDVHSDGAVMQSPVGRVSIRRPTFFSQDGIEYAERPNEVRTITLELLHTDEPYYRYQQSALQHDEASGNPFAEPVLLYSNVKGGLGVFASYNSFSIDIKP